MDYQQNLTQTKQETSKYNSLMSTMHHYEECVDKIITIRNIFGPLNSKAKVIPTKHKQTKELLGVERLSPEEERLRPYAITAKSFLEIQDGFQFNLNDETDRINWNWVQYSNQISPDRTQALMSPMSFLFIEDSERDLQKKMKQDDVAFEAELLVRRKWDMSTRMNMARLLGQDMSMHKPDEVLDYLVGMAKGGGLPAQAILDVENDKYSSERLMLLRYVDAGIVTEKNKSFYFETIRMGLDQNSALGWLIHGENKDLVDQMQAQYNRLRKPNLSGHVDAPVRGDNIKAASSTSVNPVQTAPGTLASPITHNPMTLERLAEVAPRAYAKLTGGLSTPQLFYLQETQNANRLQLLADQEMKQIMDELLAGPAVEVVSVVTARAVLDASDRAVQAEANRQAEQQLSDLLDDDNDEVQVFTARTAYPGNDLFVLNPDADTAEEVVAKTARVSDAIETNGEHVTESLQAQQMANTDGKPQSKETIAQIRAKQRAAEAAVKAGNALTPPVA